MATNFHEQILAAVKGVSLVNSVGSGIGTADPSPAPGGTSTVSSWRSRGLAPSFTDGGSGKRGWTVPAGREWQLQDISFKLQCFGTVGNRQLEVVYNPAENDITVSRHRFPAGAFQVADAGYTYNFAMGQPLMTAAIANFLTVPLPPAILPPSSSIYLWDKAQIGVGSDTFSNVNLLVLERVIS